MELSDDELAASIMDAASIEAAESVGSNSVEYDSLCEDIEERMWIAYYESLTKQTQL